MRKAFFKQFRNFLLQTGKEARRTHSDFLRLLKNIKGRPNNLLDIGTAEGRKTLEYAEALGIHRENIYGIEIAKHYIELAAKTSISLATLDLEKGRFPFTDETFEVVTCNQVLEHLKNIFLPLSEMERVLKTGGHLAIGIPNLAALHNRILLLFGFQPLCNDILGPHIRCFTHKAFLNFLKSNPNFRIITATGSSLYPFPYPAVEFGAYFFPGLSAYTFYLLQKINHNLQLSPWLVSSIGDTCLW